MKLRIPMPWLAASVSDSTSPSEPGISPPTPSSAQASASDAPAANAASTAAAASSRSLMPCTRWTRSDRPVLWVMRSSGGAAHRQCADAHVRLAHACRHALPGLAAEAYCDRQVVGDAVDCCERLDAVADQRRAAHGLRHLAVLDQVRLGDAEHEIARRRLDLSAAERDRVEAALDAGDQIVLRLRARREVGVRHARHRKVPERLAATVAGGRHAVLARAQQVVQVGNELSTFDDRGALRRSALVVDAVRAPLVGLAAVVVGGDERLRHHLAELPGPDARALLDVVGLEAMANSLVQQYAAER